MSVDMSPIMGFTGVDGFLVTTGWGTWGFKAIPAGGEQMAELIATGSHARVDRAVLAGPLQGGPADVRPRFDGNDPLMVLRLDCPHCGPRPVGEWVYGEVPDPPDELTDADERDVDRGFMIGNTEGVQGGALVPRREAAAAGRPSRGIQRRDVAGTPRC